MTDPRGHRRYREHRAAGLARIQALHAAGHTITCCLCGEPLDPFQPAAQNRNPLAPTLEHKHRLAEGGPLYQPNGPGHWAHRGCQSRQGAQTTNALKDTSLRVQVRANSRTW